LQRQHLPHQWRARPMKRRKLYLSLSALGVLVALGLLGRALAIGIPTTNPLVYTGTLLNNGVPMTGSPEIYLQVLASPDGGAPPAQVCLPVTQTVTLSNGSFSLPLDPSCLAQVHAYSNLLIDITVNGTALGTVPLAAVPYAVEADTASNPAAGSAIANLAPPGTIVAFGGAICTPGGGPPVNNCLTVVPPPPGWLLCDGSAVTSAVYPNLFSAIGTAWGNGGGADGGFNLPDMRGYFPRGYDLGVTQGWSGQKSTRDPGPRTAQNPGGNSGDTVGTYEDGEIVQHTHTVDDPGHAHQVPGQTWGFTGPLGSAYYAYGVGTVENNPATDTATTGITLENFGGDETRPNNVAVNYIIKY
jgi:microcystin-dependent protein